MPSPFPGMDPFLEAHWGDVHARLIVNACNQIQNSKYKSNDQSMTINKYKEILEQGGKAIVDTMNHAK